MKKKRNGQEGRRFFCPTNSARRPIYFQGEKGVAMVMVDNSITINEYNLNHQKRILSKPILLPCAFHARPNSLVENLITLSVG